MRELILKGLRDTSINADNILPLAESGIHTIGHMSAFDISRKRSIDTAKHTFLQASVSGEGEVLVNGRWVQSPPNTVYIVPFGADWRWRFNAATKQNWELLYVVLQPDFRFSIPKRYKEAYILKDCDPTDLLVNFRQLYKESLIRGRSTIMAHLAEIIAYLVGEIIDDTQHNYQLSKLWMVVARDLARPWDIASLCNEMSICQEKLRLLSQRETGRSPMAQVSYLRMRYACDLLRVGELNVQQIALLLGYQNPFNFSLAFKRHHGLSPSHYRKEQKKIIGITQ